MNPSSSSTTKLMKPGTISGLRRPVVKPASTDDFNLAGAGLPKNVPRMANLRRRSKSVSDLTKNVFPLRKPFGLALETLSERKNVQGFKRTMATDKKTDEPKPKVVKKDAPKPKVVQKDEAKPKVVQKAKIAAYDYKARFNQLKVYHDILKTDHISLVEVHRESANTISNLRLQNIELSRDKSEVVDINSKLEQENIQMKSDITRLSALTETLSKENTHLSLVNTEINEFNSQLTETIKTVKAQNEQLISANDRLADENQRYKSRIDDLTKNMVQEQDSFNAIIDELKREVELKEVERRHLHNVIQDLKGNIRVFCRLRPINPSEETRLLASIRCYDETEIELKKSTDSVASISGKSDSKHDFTFDKVFDPSSTQMDIFEELSQLVQSALDGYNVCVFAYGQTGSGKTYTMQGYEDEHEGMIPRSLQLIFKYSETKQAMGWTFSIEASFLEIYNESVYDLLNKKSRQVLDVLFNEGKGVTVKNLTIQPVQSYRELYKFMDLAHRNRTVASTDFNLHSSRSHAVTQIHITAIQTNTNVRLNSTLNLVDLAGSESAKTSSIERLTETKNINKSLSNLGTVMNDLSNGKKGHIPYRNSKLTFLLQSSLGGNSKTLMIVNIAPMEECFNETISSLRFANKVKCIKTNSKRNQEVLAKK